METKSQHIERLSLIYYIMAPLSMVSSLFIIITFLRFPKKLFTSQASHLKFVFFQAVCDFLFSLRFLLTALYIRPEWISYGSVPVIPLVPVNESAGIVPSWTGPDAFCVTLGFTGQFFMIASVSWNLMVSIQILQLFWFRRRYDYADISSSETPQSSTLYHHIFVWLFSFIASIAPLILRQYGATTNGCWITEEYHETRLVLFIFPLSAFLISSLIILIICLSKMQIISLRVVYAQQFDPDNFFPTMRLLVAYTMVFILFWISPVILRVLEIIHQHPIALVYGDIISISTQGMANALVWLSSVYIRDLIFTPNRNKAGL